MKPNLSNFQLFSAATSGSTMMFLVLLPLFAIVQFILFSLTLRIWLLLLGLGVTLVFGFICFVTKVEFNSAKSYYALILAEPTLTVYELAERVYIAESNGRANAEHIKINAEAAEFSVCNLLKNMERKGLLLPGTRFDPDAGRLAFPVWQHAAAQPGHEPYGAYGRTGETDYSDLMSSNAGISSEMQHREGTLPTPEPPESSASPVKEPLSQNVGVIYCGQCGAKNKDTNKFCNRCGSALDKPRN